MLSLRCFEKEREATSVRIEPMNKMRSERRVWIGIVSVAIALNGAPAFADDGIGGAFSNFFSGIANAISHLFHPSEEPSTERASIPAPSPTPSPIPSPEPSPRPSESPGVRQEGARSLIPASTPATPTSVTANVPVTHDSVYHLAGTVPAGMHWILVDAHTEKQGDLKNAPYPAVKEGDPLPAVYLPFGPGIYTVKIYFSKEVRVDGGHFSRFMITQVLNDDSSDNLFLMPSMMIQSDAPEIVELSKRITQNAVTDREKALAIHDWIAHHIAYDDNGVKDHSYTSRSFDALSILHSKITVCEGYSTLFAALARASGLHARVALGKGFNYNRPSELSDEQICESQDRQRFYPHGWNEVLIDNRWVSIDTTLDAQYNGIGQLGHENFDRNPSDFAGSHLKCSDADW
jgi:transglutaminase-like putative cysteine protease